MNPPDSEKIRIFSIFNGRRDAYGLETSLKAITVREPLTDALILDHLEGKKRIGFFPLLPENHVKTACVDLDREDKDLLARLIVNLMDRGFYPYTEKSKSKGYHIWLFFDELIYASIVREVLSQITEKAGAKEIEIFPKQGSLSQNNGLGNFIFLPLHGQSFQQGRTVFLNGQFQPYENQWNHLSKIHQTKSENILSMAGKIQEEPKAETSDSSQEDSLDVTKYLIHYNIAFRIKQDSGRTFYLLNRCLFAANHTTKDNESDSSIVQDRSGKLTYQCFHGHCEKKTWADARRKISGDQTLTKFIKGYRETGQGRNLSEDLREWVETSYGNFTTAQVYNDLDVKTTTDKTFVRVNLHRMVEKGMIERGISNGIFRKIDKETNLISIEDTILKPLPLKWPGGLEEHVKIMRKTTVGVAGTMQAGKTAFLLNAAWLNKDLIRTYYFTSEFGGDELRERLEPFGHSMEKWRTITFIERSRDFQDVIDPDALNLIDYLEVSDEGEYYKMGIQIKRIYEKLNQGVAVIGLQKKFGSDFGYGGQPTVDKPRLYITLEKSVLKIVKGKLWAGETNPNGMFRKFKLHKGARFVWDPWEFPKV